MSSDHMNGSWIAAQDAWLSLYRCRKAPRVPIVGCIVRETPLPGHTPDDPTDDMDFLGGWVLDTTLNYDPTGRRVVSKMLHMWKVPATLG